MKLFGNSGFKPEERLATSREHKLRIEKYACPQCSEFKLKTLILEEGKKGWEARVECEKCGVRAVLNDSGFHIQFPNSKEVNK